MKEDVRATTGCRPSAGCHGSAAVALARRGEIFSDVPTHQQHDQGMKYRSWDYFECFKHSRTPLRPAQQPMGG